MKHIPNILTTVRIFLIPVFILLYPQYHIAAAAVFLLACLTDVADGYIARKNNAITVFGTLFDPLADKLLQISAVVCMYTDGVVSVLVAIIVILKEFTMMSGAVYLLLKKTVVPSNLAGKTATVLVSAGIILCVAFGHRYAFFVKITEVVVIAAAAVSLSVYIVLFVKHIITPKVKHTGS